MIKRTLAFVIVMALMIVTCATTVMAAPVKGQLNVEWYKLGGPREESYIRGLIEDMELEDKILAEAELVKKGTLKSLGEKDGSDGLGLLWFDEKTLGDLAVENAEIPEPDYFAMVITGFITPEKDGKYIFSMESDDQCRLILDGKEVVGVWGTDEEDMDPELLDNDGYISETDHTFKTWNIPTESDPIELKAGKAYPIRIEYYDGWGGHFIDLKWKMEGEEDFKIIDSKYLSAEEAGGDDNGGNDKGSGEDKDNNKKTSDASMLVHVVIAGAAVFGGLKLRRK